MITAVGVVGSSIGLLGLQQTDHFRVEYSFVKLPTLGEVMQFFLHFAPKLTDQTGQWPQMLRKNSF